MSKSKVLFINTDVMPYMPETSISAAGRQLPQLMQEAGHEVRIFMPRFGIINERRNQLHEVIRLSGMNLIVNETDHPLIIKVASIQPARLQIYFIDNDEFFTDRGFLFDEAKQMPFPDSVERMLFFARGVIETILKLRWVPDVVYCQGWFAAIAPLLLKKCFAESPSFRNSKIVFAAFDNGFAGQMNNNFQSTLYNTLRREGVTKADLADIKDKQISYSDICKLALKFSEGLIVSGKETPADVIEYAQAEEKHVLTFDDCEQLDTEKYDEFFELFNPNEEEED